MKARLRARSRALIEGRDDGIGRGESGHNPLRYHEPGESVSRHHHRSEDVPPVPLTSYRGLREQLRFPPSVILHGCLAGLQ